MTFDPAKTAPPTSLCESIDQGAAWTYWAEVLRVVDGDTIDLLVDVAEYGGGLFSVLVL